MRVPSCLRFPFRRTACAMVLLAAVLCVSLAAAAQTTTAHTARHRKPRAAAKPAAVASVQPAQPVEPPKPNWPVNSQAAHAAVNWDSRSLRIEAANSSLLQILSDVTNATGTKIEGAGSDQRIFGSYGPGTVRDVLADLLRGSGYNIVMTGENEQGLPREVLLSERRVGGSIAAPMMAHPQPQPDDDIADEAPTPEPEPPAPEVPQANRPNPDAVQNQGQQHPMQPGQAQQPNN